MTTVVPMYLASECPLCVDRVMVRHGRVVPTCADCGTRIPTRVEDLRYVHNGDRGFQSFTWDHEHIAAIDGFGSGRGPAYRELCYACMRIDYFKRYPVS